MMKLYNYEPNNLATIKLPLRRTLVRLALYSAICIAALLLVAACNNNGKKPAATVLTSDVYYTCSMHPQVMQDKPGNCPICSMQLIEARKSNMQKPGEIELSDAQVQLGNIQTDTIQSGSIGNRQVLTATLNFNEEAITNISARVAGRVDRLYFKNTGDYIRKGDKLYDIYSEDLNNAKQEYLLALEKQNSLSTSLIDFAQVIESAKSKLLLWGLNENQINEIATTHTASSLTSFYSNQEGYITALNLREGDYVMDGGSIVTIANLSTIWVEAQVYTSQYAAIGNGNMVTVQIPDLNNITLRGRIAFINPEINPDTRINLVRVVLPNTDNLLRPGMPAYVYVENKQRKGISLPVDAVIRNENASSVWIKTGHNSFVNKMVQTGIETENSIEILSGIKEGDAVVVTGAYLVNSEYIFKRGANPMAGMHMDRPIHQPVLMP
ncbi:efflux RND transporter periplasmic adaptor subunit [Panacibacter sp. KCS-6]|uniref:Efflux RND transporter periplasmic adaptor subunit n=1 Tax=Limnovirga soli TaxID=2656915 RepID=A0A8J8FCB7_9BACT|nr:efflux RND transporter periplasmic adaptor subunit [Limnovirga soli]